MGSGLELRLYAPESQSESLDDVLSTLTCWAGTLAPGELVITLLITLSGAGACDTESPALVITILVLDTDLDTVNGARNFRSNISISFSDGNRSVKQVLRY